MYEVNVNAVGTALQGSSTAIYTSKVVQQILSLTTVPTSSTVTFETVAVSTSGTVPVTPDTKVALISSSDTAQTQIAAPQNIPVVIFQGKGGVNVVFNDGPVVIPHTTLDRVVVGSSGNDKIVVADAKNSHIILGTGNSTVVAGGGEDTITAGLGNSTITGGTGHAIVELKGNAADYTVTAVNGHAVVKSTGSTVVTTDISKIQYVQLDNDHALIFANDAQQAAVSTIYHAAFGRDADAGGLKYWFDAAAAGQSLAQIATSFINSPEHTALAAQTDAQFIAGLYMNTFGRSPDQGGLDYWTNVLATNANTRGEVLASFVNVAGQNLDGTVHTEPVVIGSVTVVHGIML